MYCLCMNVCVSARMHPHLPVGVVVTLRAYVRPSLLVGAWLQFVRPYVCVVCPDTEHVERTGLLMSVASQPSERIEGPS